MTETCLYVSGEIVHRSVYGHKYRISRSGKMKNRRQSKGDIQLVFYNPNGMTLEYMGRDLDK